MALIYTRGYFFADGEIVAPLSHRFRDDNPHLTYTPFAEWLPAALITHNADDYLAMEWSWPEFAAYEGFHFTRKAESDPADHSIDSFDTIAPDKRDDLRDALTEHHESDVRSDLNTYTALYRAYCIAERDHRAQVRRLAPLSPSDSDYAEALSDEADAKADRNDLQDSLDKHEPHWLKVLIGDAVITGYGHGNYTITGENIDAFAESLATLASADIESDRASNRLTRPDPVFRHNLGELIAENIRKDEKITDDSIRTIPKNLEVADLAATYALLKTASSG